MRNPIVQMLPAGAELTIAIDPPISIDERPFVLTTHGRQSVAIEVKDDKSVVVKNPMAYAVPFVFFIGPQAIPTSWMTQMLGFLKTFRQGAPK